MDLFQNNPYKVSMINNNKKKKINSVSEEINTVSFFASNITLYSYFYNIIKLYESKKKITKNNYYSI